ncbi:putative two component response regulator [Ameyamaea chiangmaiensis NBRC 103196]|uniref:Response regulator n=1 Tax=Ameyamaea chiangmaiensis TaxID=442969 RepID=A0A850PGD2_9PROT|nr:response regulator [Ameyamaea chiangmaiensis]MBS4074736.1 response regulator [Ameyamaea chiangmaiensis]NVN40221.1 response regulator [Ameyamaea chiangmaiensis]GBQ62554.1 putative two component response regulator [Ameyamaea chiangmaiensis NBRC 103196]
MQDRVILVVDDEWTIRMLVGDVVEDFGYRLLEAGTGPQALALLRDSGPIDLLITDLRLPGGVSGLDIAGEARTRQPGLRVLFMTGYADAGLMTMAATDPSVRVVLKPFDIRELQQTIETFLVA